MIIILSIVPFQIAGIMWSFEDFSIIKLHKSTFFWHLIFLFFSFLYKNDFRSMSILYKKSVLITNEGRVEYLQQFNNIFWLCKITILVRGMIHHTKMIHHKMNRHSFLKMSLHIRLTSRGYHVDALQCELECDELEPRDTNFY